MNQLINFLETFCIIEVAEALSVGNTKRRIRYYLFLMAASVVLAWGACVPGWGRLVLLAEYVLIFLYVVRSYSFRLRKFDAYLYVFFSILTVSVLKAVISLPAGLAAGGETGSVSALVTAVVMTLFCSYIRKKDLLFHVREGMRYWSRRSCIFAAIFCILFITPLYNYYK